MPEDDLTAWIEELRRRVWTSELATLRPIRLEPWLNLDAPDLLARRMLAQVDRIKEMPDEQRRHPAIVARRKALARHLRMLRGHIGDRAQETTNE